MQPHQVPYKTINDVTLQLHLFTPDRTIYPGPRPAILFFFGGGWMSGTAEQFYSLCEHFARRGFVAASADYRIQSKHGSTPFDSVEDGADALSFLRGKTEEWSIDPQRVVAAGGSAGGHLAACTALFGHGSGSGASAAGPDALVLFNPVLDTTATGYLAGVPRLLGRELELSPAHHVRGGLPPTLIMHGTADQVAPYENGERFHRQMLEHGNRCTLVPFEGRGHGFFNKGHANGQPGDLEETIRYAERFLHELGYPLGQSGQGWQVSER
ncbi:alpha/beta hydrolase [Paenibacillus sp. 1P07SE]|uniref:alpha/beta hydrolase n=1 Tax=Paenibacillus sp. 1P07SE TaxID=3132209 RepID=UPI0039A4D9C1